MVGQPVRCWGKIGKPQHLRIERRDMKAWEETVLPITYFEEAEHIKFSRVEVALDQAEATWKPAFEAGKQAGRKEVIDKIVYVRKFQMTAPLIADEIMAILKENNYVQIDPEATLPAPIVYPPNGGIELAYQYRDRIERQGWIKKAEVK